MLPPRPLPVATVLRRLLEAGDRPRLDKALAIMPPAELAHALPQLSRDHVRAIVDALLRLRKAGLTLRELSPGQLRQILAQLDDSAVIEIVKRLPPDDAVDFIQDLPFERSTRILNGLNLSEATQLRELLVYSPETAGGLMTTQFFALRESDTAGGAIAALRQHGQDQGLFYLYVLDNGGRLRGVVSLHALILAEPTTPIRSLMHEQVFTIQPSASQAEAAKIIAQYDLIALPVVDEAGKMLGVITVDDVVDVIREEATEDLYLMAGLSEDDRVFTTWSHSVRLRLPWLALNLATALLASRVVALFESELEQVALLAVFMPIVAGMGGNAATQTITVMVRGLALGDLDQLSMRKAVGKEILVALVNGVTTGTVGGVIAYLLTGKPVLGLVLCLAMVINNGVAALSGTLIPLGLRALRLDPAIAASIFVTTFTDVFGFLSFLGLASLFLHYF